VASASWTESAPSAEDPPVEVTEEETVATAEVLNTQELVRTPSTETEVEEEA
jgi:hypothetical protein